jgi:tetratricopeptide (TPR) repeat protein
LPLKHVIVRSFCIHIQRANATVDVINPNGLLEYVIDIQSITVCINLTLFVCCVFYVCWHCITCNSRTVINQDAFNNWDAGKVTPPPGSSSHFSGDAMDSAAFMAAMEEDCRERAERRKRHEKEAEQLKLLGNKQFTEGNYEKAVEFYTSALKEVRDWTILWTNRAQAYIKLGNFEASFYLSVLVYIKDKDLRWLRLA